MSLTSLLYHIPLSAFFGLDAQLVKTDLLPFSVVSLDRAIEFVGNRIFGN